MGDLELGTVIGRLEGVGGISNNTHIACSSIPQRTQQLEGDPFLLNRSEVWSCAVEHHVSDGHTNSIPRHGPPDTIIKTRSSPLANEISSLIRLDERLICQDILDAIEGVSLG